MIAVDTVATGIVGEQAVADVYCATVVEDAAAVVGSELLAKVLLLMFTVP